MKEQTLANADVTIKKVKPKTAKKAQKKKVELKPYQIESELRKLYQQQHKSAGQISRDFGVGRGTILRYLKKFDIPITTRTSPKTGPSHLIKNADRSYRKKQWLEKQLKSGLSMFKIATLCRVRFSNVKYYTEKYGLLELAQQQRTKAKTKKNLQREF